MTTVITSSPAKIILFGEHGVNRQQPALSTAVDLRLFCRTTRRSDDGYTFRSGERYETGDRDRLLAYKADIDLLREEKALDDIRERARDFFAPTRYVLAHLAEQFGGPGLNIEWRSPLPIGAGMGSGAAASTSMILAALTLAGRQLPPGDLAHLAWQGDIIAHGGIASSLDSSTIAYGGLIRYTVIELAQPLPYQAALPLVIGDTRVETTTAEINTRLRLWLDAHPARLHLFKDMGYLVRQAQAALEQDDRPTLGRLMNLHQLFQEKIGTSCPESERLIEAAIGAGALGAKISGSGGGGIIIALAEPEQQQGVAAAIEAAGGRSYISTAGAERVRVEPAVAWDMAPH